MSKSFLITSHTEGLFPFEQRTILHGLVSSLKRYFPDCFILLTSQSAVSEETQRIVDYVIVDKKTINIPHGNGELILVKTGIDIMKQFGRTDFYKIAYDFIIDDTNYCVFDQWASHGKSFVTCGWEIKGSGLGTWVWYGKTDVVEQIFDIDVLNNYIECKLLESIQQKNLLDQCYIYKDHEDLFNSDWYSRCDLVHEGGNRLQYNYGSVIAIVELNDSNESVFLARLYSILNQTRDPDSLLIVDRRSTITDLRKQPYYQKVLDLFVKNRVQWSVIFGGDHNQLLIHLSNLGYTWCWLVGNEDFLARNTLEIFYEHIIFNHEIGSIIDHEKNVFYRNKIVSPSDTNSNFIEYIISEMIKTQFKNLELK